jgi:hypothetical protein
MSKLGDELVESMAQALSHAHGKRTRSRVHKVAISPDEIQKAQLESAAKRLRDIEAGHSLRADSFKLVGSGRITMGIEDPVAQIRREADAAVDRKLSSLAKGKRQGKADL